jgi:hypothetical protein
MTSEFNIQIINSLMQSEEYASLAIGLTVK